ncbi:valine--tRNA ligase [Candidatus Falkowbacteria bacterium RIFOXYB2_FULL_38_15]|uniref:Valine--tRNA ligase n=1 Tax=Candidatus Falkowbacteria bacterium RIFOXYA2_FULL_38_12 TaxID=1797993 RepID=A0A1F5S4H6_9BACT|nr:MAG: valine--tRNA ligase [Candidatus Falkowbacteria bacterium RIFOXYA2_FULL_38_12]OGF32750.1 MAG: valine--tRNA ligase [Candidatus Falkowbacteria bacterium RIFOXYB2_FULL_38_15]OGF42214.1 MAG: valine--tRNA ligase [Candidatus Falkowbacteria bacterium RIFOXYD2_FULL_39_16]
MKEIEKAYNPKGVEDKIYKKWEDSGFFNPDNLPGKPYSIMMPPPNVTGVLHLGHSLENSLMDAMARYQRLRGKKVLLLPGTDHAAVATQAKVEKILMEKGIKNPRQELGREKLLKEIRDFSENSKKIILGQIKKMGTSCDWSRLAYTFDEDRNKAVNEIFKKMYEDGLIYRGFRAVNWSTKGQSTLSDDEIVHIPRKAKLYTFKYSKDFPITIATTRPETKLGDTAVAVNPKDLRYKKYIGKEFDVDFVGQKLHIKVIADNSIDINFGTGALGVTPAHSLVDYEMGVKNNLPIIKVINEDGKMAGVAGDYEGLKIEDAREKIVDNLKKTGLLEKEEEIEQNVGTSDRFGDIVEVLPKTQWFVAVNKEIPSRGKSLKDLMREAVGKNGVKITPKRFEKVYFSWIDNLRDWCISRQIWWGHRVPIWYRLNSDLAEIYKQNPEANRHLLDSESRFVVSETNPGDNNDKDYWIQDPDTLDTWFSSGLWTFSTLGWPQKTKELKMFHPTNWMQMGHEILFFWMARMILMSSYALKEIPFKDIYIHGILRDENGKKFSKSSGNNIDPLEVIEKYGTDALRFSLLSGVAPGQDQRFYFEKVEGARNLVNKLWNISRYILTTVKKIERIEERPEPKTLYDKWILDGLDFTTSAVTTCMNRYEFSSASEIFLRNFTWGMFADWYIEVSKIEKNKDEILLYILERLLKLWHPFMPFVTEEIWKNFFDNDNNENLLMIQGWPEILKDKRDIKVEKEVKLIQETIVSIRNLRAENKIEPAKIINIELNIKNTKLFEENLAILEGLLRSKIQIKKSKSSVPEIKILIDEMDAEKNKLRIKKELEEKEKYAANLKQRLENKEFISRAPKNIVDAEKEKFTKVEEEIKNLRGQIESLS